MRETNPTFGAHSPITSTHQSYMQLCQQRQMANSGVSTCKFTFQATLLLLGAVLGYNLVPAATSGRVAEPQPTFPGPALVITSSSRISLRSRTTVWTHKILRGTAEGGITVFCITWARGRFFPCTFFTSKLHRKMI